MVKNKRGLNENQKNDFKAAVQEWKEMLTDTFLYHADRIQMHVQTNGRTKVAALKNKFFSHPYVLNYKEKIGFDIEHFSHRLTGALTHRDWYALWNTIKSVAAKRKKEGDAS